MVARAANPDIEAHSQLGPNDQLYIEPWQIELTYREFMKIHAVRSPQALEYRAPVKTFRYGGSIAIGVPRPVVKAMQLSSSRPLFCRFEKDVGLIYDKRKTISSEEVEIPLHFGSSSSPMVIIPKEFHEKMGGIKPKLPLQLFLRRDASCFFIQTFADDVLKLIRE